MVLPAVLVLLGSALVALRRGAEVPPPTASVSQSLGVPAYFFPVEANMEHWQRLRQGAPTVRVAIVTGLGLDGGHPIAAYQREIALTHDAGVLVLAYITTRSAEDGTTRPMKDITSDIDQAYSWYGIGGVLDGIFFDEAVDYPVTCAQRETFVALDRYVKAKDGTGTTVINHGQILPECYATAADVIVNAEMSYDLYKDWQPWGWEDRYPATKFWHLIHGVATVGEMREVVALSRRRRAGTVYVTGAPAHDPYGALPEDQYWESELRAVAAMFREPSG